MSNSLVRKGLELLGYEKSVKQEKKKRKHIKYKGTLDLIPAKHRILSKNAKTDLGTILGRTSKVTVYETQKKLATQEDPTDKNVQRLLMLSTNHIDQETSSKLLDRAIKKRSLSKNMWINNLKKLKMSSKKWFVLGISGATCSGKTSLANRLHKELENSIVIHQDNYFLPIDDPRHTKIEELNHFNWELTSSVDMDRMHSDILKLIESTPDENSCSDTINKNILILDGFLLFKCKVISDLCDCKYFLTLTKDQCWERRKGRVYNPPDVPGYFEKVVWPEYLKNIDELTKDKDLCETIKFVDGSKSKEEIFQMVFTEIKKLLS
ncbi:Nicotinamide riboside kinase 1 [Anthophora quadrimaculata]